MTMLLKKGHKYFILLPCLYCSTAISQNYIPFPFQNGQWIYGEYDANCLPQGYCGPIIYKFQGDTFLLGRSYHKLYAKIWGAGYYTYDSAIRQDSIDGKIYAMLPSNCNDVDTLLYDFNKNINDTL